MSAQPPLLNFPATFCCNCGNTDCASEPQQTRVARFHGFGGHQATFQFVIPVCAACLKTTRRRPSGWAPRALVWLVTTAVLTGALYWWSSRAVLPAWLATNLLAVGAVVSLVLVVLFYRLRRPKPPQTSWYQPVRIKRVRMQFGETAGQVSFMKLAFTNHDYLNVFASANRDAIQAKIVAAVKA